jgi:hypothetical protein
MGGPLSGVPWSNAIGTLVGGGAGGVGSLAAEASKLWTDGEGDKSITGIIVPTIVQTAADVLSYWTSMTCLYDRYWAPDPDRATLPVCMFHATDIKPTYAVETSKKRVLLYEQKGADSPEDLLRPNTMRAVIDNAVKQPTIYAVEAIVPFQPVGRYVAEGVKTVTDMLASFIDILGGGPAADVVESVFSSVYALLKTAGTAAEAAGKLPRMDGVSYINMNSLEAMAESCRTLCMKMWTGYSYKFVQLVGMTYAKKGQEDDVFRATLSLQEMPVLTLSPLKGRALRKTGGNWVVKSVGAAQDAAIAPLIWLTRAKEAAGGGYAGGGMAMDAIGEASGAIKEALGKK